MDGRKRKPLYMWDNKEVSRATYFRKKKKWLLTVPAETDSDESDGVASDVSHPTSTISVISDIHPSNSPHPSPSHSTISDNFLTTPSTVIFEEDNSALQDEAELLTNHPTPSTTLSNQFEASDSIFRRKHQTHSIIPKLHLLKWRVRHNISRECGNELLHILSQFSEEDLRTLPRDIRTLEPNFDNTYRIKPLPPGQFAYFGLKEILELPDIILFNKDPIIGQSLQQLRVSFNIDGIPAFHTGGKGFWPILASVNDGPVFIVALYYGIKKPIDVNQFLFPLVQEIQSFYGNVTESDTGDAYIILGAGENQRKFEFVLDKILTDVPAKSYILCTKGHSGYYSCSKCKIKGTLINKTVYFPSIGENMLLRTSDEYRNVSWDTTDVHLQLDQYTWEVEEQIIGDELDAENDGEESNLEASLIHHDVGFMERYFAQVDEDAEVEEDLNDEYDTSIDDVPQAIKSYHHRRSVLADIPNFDIVRRVPLDYMHLVLAGVTKRLLTTWLRNFKKDVFIEQEAIHKISHRLKLIAQNYFPKEFQRKPDNLDFIGTWKCTQFREFLLYIGVAVLYDVIHIKYLTHFHYLSAACRLLCSRSNDLSREETAKTAQMCFTLLVEDLARVYGNNFITHNVHNLIHLADDFRQFGCLDNFSCFKYESFLGKIKHYIKSGNRPLEQVINKYVIQLYTQEFSSTASLWDITEEYFEIPTLEGLVPNTPIFVGAPDYSIHYECFKLLKYRNLVLRTDNTRDCYCLVNSAIGEQHYMRFSVILRDKVSHEIFIVGHVYKTTRSLYTKPFPSYKVGVVVAEEEHLEVGSQTFPLSQVIRKCFVMPLGDGGPSSVFFPKTASQLVLVQYLHQ